jgi:serine/threonine-protein kinase RsbW
VTPPAAISAEVPATAEFVQVLRNVAAGVAARLDMPIDQIEEIRLAVAEAASLLLAETAGTNLRLAIRRDDDVIDVTLASDGGTDGWVAERIEASWAWLVLQRLSDDVRWGRDERHDPSIGFAKRHTPVMP